LEFECLILLSDGTRVKSLSLRRLTMITALVQFKLPQPVSREKAQEFFVASAPK
jgi:hypothetical protein